MGLVNERNGYISNSFVCSYLDGIAVIFAVVMLYAGSSCLYAFYAIYWPLL